MRKTITYKGTKVVYSHSGGGQTLVLLHGFLEDRSMWDDFATELSSTFSIIAIDLLGQGETGDLGYVHSMEDHANAVIAVLENEDVKRCMIVGHSMGGYVALALAESNPTMLDRMVLFHSTSFADSADRRKDRERVISLVQKNKSVYIKTVIPSLFAETWRKKLKTEIQGLIDAASSYSNQGIVANIRGMMDRKDRRHILQKAVFPKLIIHGQLDSVIPLADIQLQAKLNSNISLLMIDGIGHMGHMEARSVTLEAIKEFCQS